MADVRRAGAGSSLQSAHVVTDGLPRGPHPAKSSRGAVRALFRSDPLSRALPWPGHLRHARRRLFHDIMAAAMEEKDDRVPVFGTWPRIYAAVVACALLVMGLVALFSSWRY